MAARIRIAFPKGAIGIEALDVRAVGMKRDHIGQPEPRLERFHIIERLGKMLACFEEIDRQILVDQAHKMQKHG